jgi:hypothetical protein
MNRLLDIRLLAIAILTFAVPLSASATMFVFTADLAGPNENPPVPSEGTGTAVVTYDDVAQTLAVSVTFQDLVGTTTVAHIHCCVDEPGNVGVATFPGTFPGFPAGVTSGAYANSWDLTDPASYTADFLATAGGTAADAEAALFAGLSSTRAYVNIHTSFAGGGEIRGFLVPEPSTGLAVTAGLAALAARRRAVQRR